MNGFSRRLIAVIRPSMWILFLTVVQIKAGHIMAAVSNASTPFPVREAFEAMFTGNMTLPDAGQCCVSLISWATASIAQHAMQHPGQLLYDLWLVVDLIELWHKRPWAKRLKESPVQGWLTKYQNCQFQKNDNDN